MNVLDGKVALVTGSARGIGRAAAALLVEHGATVMIADLDEGQAPESAAEIGGTTAVFGGDLTKEGVCEALVEATVSAFGKLDIVVNNAGYTWDGIAHKMSDEQFRAMLEIHTVVPFRILKAAAPHLREPAKQEAAEGREVFRKVVNVTSISGTQGNVGQANYSAAKAGLVGLTKTLAREWGPSKVNVNAVAFGFVQTRLTAPPEEAGTFRRDDVEIPLGIPERMRELAAHDHPARPCRDARGGRRPDLLPLLAVVELRARPGDHGERRPDDGDDDVSSTTEQLALDALGTRATRQVRGRPPRRFASTPRQRTTRTRGARGPGRDAGVRDRAGLGGDRPGLARGRDRRGQEARRPLPAGHGAAPADRGRDEARLERDAGGARSRGRTEPRS